MHIEIWENLTENYEKLKYPCRVHEPKTMSCIWKKYINLIERIILPVIVSMKKDSLEN